MMWLFFLIGALIWFFGVMAATILSHALAVAVSQQVLAWFPIIHAFVPYFLGGVGVVLVVMAIVAATLATVKK